MDVQETVQKIRKQEWIKQISECRQSGLTVPQWCEQNGVKIKTYYYRMRRVREELLSAVGAASTLQIESYDFNQNEKPVFAALPMPKRSGLAITIQIGTHIAEIHNGADTETVEGVLRALTRL